MKKLLAIILCLCVLFSFAACSGNSGETQPPALTYQGITATFVGDSITNGAKLNAGEPIYWQLVQTALGFDKTVGMGVNGSCYSTKSDFGMDHEPLPTRYKKITQTDLIFLALGSNDFGRNTPMGTIEDQEDVSFYGAINFVLNELESQCPESQIILMTPIIRYDKNQNALGLKLEDYINAIKAVGEKRGLPVVDMYAATASKLPSGLFSDTVHPDKLGHQIMATALQTWLEENIEAVLG